MLYELHLRSYFVGYLYHLSVKTFELKIGGSLFFKIVLKNGI